MAQSPSLLVVAAASALLAGAAVFGACSSSGSGGVSFPMGAQPISGSFNFSAVPTLPAECTGNTYVKAPSKLCSGGNTYFLCDGMTYSEFDCSDPGMGWSAAMALSVSSASTTGGGSTDESSDDTPTEGRHHTSTDSSTSTTKGHATSTAHTSRGSSTGTPDGGSTTSGTSGSHHGSTSGSHTGRSGSDGSGSESSTDTGSASSEGSRSQGSTDATESGTNESVFTSNSFSGSGEASASNSESGRSNSDTLGSGSRSTGSETTFSETTSSETTFSQSTASETTFSQTTGTETTFSETSSTGSFTTSTSGTTSSSSSGCEQDLTDIGPADFRVLFTLTTTQRDNAIALVNQRSSCFGGTFWDVRVEAGTIHVEVDSTSGGGQASIAGCAVVNDGFAHSIIVQRVSGVITIYVDSRTDSSGEAAASWGQLPPLATGTDACDDVDSGEDTTPFNFTEGSIENVCVSPGSENVTSQGNACI